MNTNLTEFEQYITDLILDKYGIEFKKQFMYMTYFGSMLYGTKNEDSDIDLRGIYLPTKESILRAEPVKILSINAEYYNTKIDIQLWPIQKFFNYLEKGDINAIDILFSYTMDNNFNYNGLRDIFINKKYLPYKFTKYLKHNKLININNNIISCLNYVRSQQYKYQNKIEDINTYESILKYLNSKNIYKNYLQTDIPKDKKLRLKNYKDGIVSIVKEEQLSEDYINIYGRNYYIETPIEYFYHIIEDKIKQYGKRVSDNRNDKDWKSISHSVRVLFEIEELLDNKEIYFPNKYSDTIKNIKNNKIKYNLVEKFINIKYEKIIKKIKSNDHVFKGSFDKKYELIVLEDLYC